MSTYDNQWTLSYTLSNPVPEDEKGLFIGNGKIGLVTSFKSFDVESTMITTQLKYYNGAYKANIIEPFYVTNVNFFDNNTDNTTVTIESQSLHMGIGMFTSKGNVIDNISSKQLDIECDTYTPRQLPFSIMQTYRVTPTENMTQCDFFHDVYAKESIVDVEYNNNVIFNDNIAATKGVYILSGKGRSRITGESIACATCYMFELDESNYQNLGFNIYRKNVNQCYNRFRLLNLQQGVTFKIHIVSAILTSFDFENPIEEVKRIVLNVINKGTTVQQSASRLRTEHTIMWDELWKTDISVVPKTGITVQETTDFNKLKRNLRYSLYNIFSSVRENVNLEVNPMNLSIIDHDGTILYDGDMWFIPMLVMIKPDIARAILEYRYNLITVARQLAAGYGYKGAKFPYVNDTVGYKNTLYYDVVSPMSIFNTALVSINVWNYFRVTRDRDWLMSKGYPILKDNADFFASRITKDDDGTYHLRNVVGLNNIESIDQNTFTNNMVKLALRCAIEATYELSYFVKEAWLDCYYNLPLLYFPDDNIPSLRSSVLMFDADDTKQKTYDILEPLFVLLPYYSYIYFLPEASNHITAIKKNLDLYITKLNENNADHPYNIALLAVCYGIYAQHDTEYVTQFRYYLYRFVDLYTQGIWKHIGFKDKKNDIIMNTLLLFIILQGCVQLNIQGGVAETRFYYDEMRITGLSTANMPNTWKNVKIVGSGANLSNFTTTNAMYYVQ